MKGLFITGTDTDAGKTTVTAALLRALKVAGVPAAAVKPVSYTHLTLPTTERV